MADFRDYNPFSDSGIQFFNPFNPLYGGIGSGTGFLGLGPQALDQDFSFNLSKPKYSTNPDLLEAIQNLNQQGGTLNALGKRTAGAGDEFMQQYRQMLDPRSAYNRGQYSLLRGQVGDTA